MAKLKVELTLKNAQAAARKGKLAEARQLYQSVLAEFPANRTALQELAKLDEQIRRQRSGQPLNIIIKNLGALLAKGHFQDAIEQSQSLLIEHPDMPVIWYILGLASLQTGKFNDAVSAFDQAISLKPDYLEAHMNKGYALQIQGHHDDAISSFQQALAIKPDLPQGHNNIGNAWRQQGKLQNAIAAYQRALTINPALPEALYNLGRCWQDLEKMEEAHKAYQKALAIQPNLPEAWNDLGAILLEQRHFKDASKALLAAIKQRPQFTEAHSNLATALYEQDHIEEAIQSCYKALSLNPDHASAYNNLGIIYTSMGEQQKAQDAFGKALSIRPTDSQALYNICSHKKHTADDPEIDFIEATLLDPSLSSKDKCLLHYTLAKIYEETGQLQASLRHYKAGGAQQVERLQYDISKDEELFDSLRRSASAIRQKTLSPSASEGTITPIFILGMPRSGTSLIEQIVSNHSHVHGGGELELATNYGLKISSGEVQATEDTLQSFRTTYLAALSEASDGASFVTDKMPNNFRQIALIRAALPEAKIVHVKRNAAATCWSNFKTYFAGNGLGYSYNLDTVVSYFKLYQNLMAYWEQLFGGQIINLNYDALTSDPDTQIQTLISQLGLPWQVSCLSPHKSRRMVKTASNLQVRRPIYKGSSEEWRKFEPFLDGTFDTLHF